MTLPHAVLSVFFFFLSLFPTPSPPSPMSRNKKGHGKQAQCGSRVGSTKERERRERRHSHLSLSLKAHPYLPFISPAMIRWRFPTLSPTQMSLECVSNSHSTSPLLCPYAFHTQYFSTEPIIPPPACFFHSPLYLLDSQFQVVALLSTQPSQPEAKERDILDSSSPSTPAGTNRQTMPGSPPPDPYHSHVKPPVSTLQISFSPHDFCLFVVLILC